MHEGYSKTRLTRLRRTGSVRARGEHHTALEHVEDEHTMAEAGNEPKATIMIVEDQEVVRSLVADLLTNLSYGVVTAKDGQEAVATYQRLMDEAREQDRQVHPIDLVILDMVLPNGGGEETFERLRQINPDVRVIISTGYDVDDRVHDILGRGAVGFLPKPYHIETLLNLVHKVLA